MIKKIWTGLVICILITCALSANVFAENYDSTQEKEYYTIDEAKDNESEEVFIKRNDRFYPISHFELLYGAWSISSLDNEGFSNDDFSSIPSVFMEEGDQLVTFKHVSEYAFSPVTATYYAYPVEISIDPSYNNHKAWKAITNYGQSIAHIYALSLDYDTYENIYELEGKSDFQTKDEVLSILSSKNISTVSAGSFGSHYFLVSDQPASLKAGTYKGTEYIETTIQLDYHYFQYGSKTTAPVTKTHEGYFMIDLSGLETGLYVIDVGSNWTNKYVISVEKENTVSPETSEDDVEEAPFYEDDAVEAPYTEEVPASENITEIEVGFDSQTDSDLRHGITKLNDVDGLRIIDSSNYIFGVLKGQLYDSRFIPENISQLSYFPSGLLKIWDYVNDLYFEKEQNGQVITIRTNVGDLLSGEGSFSCLCSLHGQYKQVGAVTIDSTTFQYELPEEATEDVYWWLCSTYGGIDENNGNDVTGMIYFNILDGKITEAAIELSNQEVSIYFKSVYGQFNEVNYAKSGTELNLKYDFYSDELASASGF